MEGKPQLEVNSALFGDAIGVMGRSDFALNALWLSILFLPVGFIFGVLGEANATIAFVVTILPTLGLLFAAMKNYYRRIRDILGHDENEILWFVGATIFHFIPFLNLAMLIFLVAKKGVVTSPKSAVPLQKFIGEKFRETVGGFQAGYQGESVKEKKSPSENDNIVSKLQELTKLKEDGHLTEDEFVSAKNKVLQKTG